MKPNRMSSNSSDDAPETEDCNQTAAGNVPVREIIDANRKLLRLLAQRIAEAWIQRHDSRDQAKLPTNKTYRPKSVGDDELIR